MELIQQRNQLTDKQRYWLNHIAAADIDTTHYPAAYSQYLSLTQYATQHNLSLKALYNWHWILKSN